MRAFASRAGHVRMRSDTHIELGCPRLYLTLLVQLPSSRKHSFSVPHREASRYSRLPNHPDAS